MSTIRVALIPGELEKARLLSVDPNLLGEEICKHMSCKEIDFIPISEVHTFYFPADGPYAEKNWKVLVRATDTTGETLVDVSDDDVRELPVIVKRHDDLRNQMSTFFGMMDAIRKK